MKKRFFVDRAVFLAARRLSLLPKISMASVLLLNLLWAAFCFAGKPSDHQYQKVIASDTGLEAVESPHFDHLMVTSTFSMPAGRKIFLEDIEAEFAPSWVARFQKKTSPAYRAGVIRNFTQALRGKLEAHLIDHGWQVVESSGTNVVSLQIRLVDLYISGPQISEKKQVLVKNIGNSGVEAVLVGPGDQVIMKIVDHRDAGGLTGAFVETNNAIMYHHFSKLMANWAKDISGYLWLMMDVVADQSKFAQANEK